MDPTNFTQPVPPDLMKFAIGVFQAAAMGQPGSHIVPADPDEVAKAQAEAEEGDLVIQFTNQPLNRGMLAVSRETPHLTDQQRMSLMSRVMHFGQAVNEAADDPRFREHIRLWEQGLEVSDAFTAACAACAFDFSNDDMRLDLNDLARLLDGAPSDVALR